MSKDTPPEWAFKRAQVVGSSIGLPAGADTTELARYIAEHEEPPVDPLLIEARKICNSPLLLGRGLELKVPLGWLVEEKISEGRVDDNACIQIALLALKRGIEIEREKSQ